MPLVWARLYDSCYAIPKVITFWVHITWITVGEKWTNREKNFRDGKSWTPTVFKNVQTDYALKMIHKCYQQSISNPESFVGWETIRKHTYISFIKVCDRSSVNGTNWRHRQNTILFVLKLPKMINYSQYISARTKVEHNLQFLSHPTNTADSWKPFVWSQTFKKKNNWIKRLECCIGQLLFNQVLEEIQTWMNELRDVRYLMYECTIK